jgi:hypothetical protein
LYNIDAFTRDIAQKFLKSSYREAAVLFKQLDKTFSSEINMRGFVDVVNEYRTQKHTEVFNVHNKIEEASKPTKPMTNKQATNLSEVLQKISNFKGASLTKFFQLLIESTNDPEEGLQMDTVKDTIKSLYGNILSDVEILLF